jgi:hypothetical protein
VASLNISGPITLQGNVVRIEPLSVEHVPGLAAVGIDDEIWGNMPYGAMDTEQDIDRWVRGVLALAESGSDIPFAVIHLQSGRIAGATRYMDIRPAHRGVEIGAVVRWNSAARA